ncbi:thiamine-phosphate kinase [Arboricoccus pini]|nr:thiamine-phosphate kinase [Arboricoccus pini]
MINRYLKPLAKGFPGALALTDDAALIDCCSNEQIVIAKDALVENVHFLSSDPVDLIARKLLRTNLSDMAAMGAKPFGYLTMIAWPPTLQADFFPTFAKGLAADQREFAVHLLGGDTVSTSGPLVLSLTILGSVPKGHALTRSAAKIGDLVFVSGTLGDAALGLRVLRGLAATEDEALALVDRYRLPRPRIALGQALLGVAGAAIDVSDGLLADLGHIASTSAVGIDIDIVNLPLSEAARSLPGALEAALSGGDDYELAFTVPPGKIEEALMAAKRAGVPITQIGRVTERRGVRALDRQGQQLELAQTGWVHF